ncbi:hypothetical protein JKP88DRAFT_350502 [Tribonema minus]|uniref:Uncharacterized protein n=1 Tax=Tribonema minus TaxID=303371 RepID=A0A835YP04_9STRA|nr:hypothetical protein JKP88DRAFT_350502 [Tribonema minus]
MADLEAADPQPVPEALPEAVAIVTEPMSVEPLTGLQPALALRVPRSTSTRLFIVMRVLDNFSRGRPLNAQNRDMMDDRPGMWRSLRTAAPPQLQLRGITDSEWRAWLERFEAEVQSQHVAGGGLGFLCVWLTVIGIPYLFYVSTRYQRAVAAWLTAINEELFEPRGMYATTQTVTLNFQVRKHDGKVTYGAGELGESSWLVIALNPQEAAVLRAEPHLWETRESSAAAPYVGGLSGGLVNMYPEVDFCTKTWCCIGWPRII